MLKEIDDSDQEAGEDESGEGEDCTKRGETPMELSMNLTVGITGNDTMKVQGQLQGKEVSILIDSGATDNFISSDTV